MLNICFDEFERLKEALEKNIKTEGDLYFVENDAFLDFWEYEDEFSHNEIEENQDKFIQLANHYFQENNLPYYADTGNQNVRVYRKNDSNKLSHSTFSYFIKEVVLAARRDLDKEQYQKFLNEISYDICVRYK